MLEVDHKKLLVLRHFTMSFLLQIDNQLAELSPIFEKNEFSNEIGSGALQIRA